MNTKENKKTLQNTNQNGETSTSTQHNTSKILGKSLLRDHYSEAEETEVEQQKWEKLKNGPFMAVGPEGGPYKLTFGNHVVSPMKFKNIEEAEEYVNKKEWDLILVTTAVFMDVANKKKQELENEN